MHFYIPNLKAGTLTETQAAHLFVMRVQENKTYKATDLEGRTCKILITKVDKKTKTIEFEQAEIPKTFGFKPKAMFQAIPDKVYLDKLCEVLPLSGLTDLFLFYSENSIEYPINKERITKILIRSCEQAQVAYLPKIVVLNKKDLEIELKKYKPTVLDCNTPFALTLPLPQERGFDASTGVTATTVSPSESENSVTEGLLIHGKNSRNQISALQYSNMEPQGFRYETPYQNTVTQSPSFPTVNYPALIGPEGGWTESEIQYFQSLDLSFSSLGQIIYPAWIAGLVWESSRNLTD
jgi:16S rRNA U1498 N3-methylase RsmE